MLGFGLGLACTPRCGCDTEHGRPGAIDNRDFGDAVIADPQWSVSVGEGGGIRVRYNHVDVIVGGLAFAGGSGPLVATPAPTVFDGDEVGFSSEVLALRVRVRGASRPEPNGVTVEYVFEADADVDDVLGGGLEFTLRNEPRVFGKRAADPVMLDDDKGFVWDTGRGELRFEFDTPLAKVAFAPRGSGGVMRCGFYADELEAGTRTIRLRVRLPDGGIHRRSVFASYAAPDPGWHADTMPWTDVPVDLSFLNADDRPAGRHGPVRVEGEGFVRGDGAPLRLWGTNVVGYAIFSQDDAAIVAQARRLAAFGFNLVRLHHHDSVWVRHNVFGKRARGTRVLDVEALERLDRWVAALQAEGIYVWLDLHVGRTFTSEDGVDAFDELERGDPRGFNFVNPSIVAHMKEFARAYLEHENHLTHRRYGDDPGILGVLVTNENDIVHHFGNRMAAKERRPRHQGWLDDQVDLAAARTGLDVPRPIEPWKLGETKIVLADIEAGFFLDAIGDLRSAGYRGPIATTQLWGDESLYALPSLTTGDVIDVHAYGHPETLSSNAHVDAHFLHAVGTAAVAGLPTMVSEWNIPWPARDRFAGPTLVAATAALQRWDAMMLFAYASNPIEPPSKPDKWPSWDDPSIMAMMPAAALMFRRGDVSAANERFAVVLDRAAVFERSSNAQNLATVRSLLERSEVRVVLPAMAELPWLRGTEVPEGATVLTDPDDDRLEAQAQAVESDTGELRRDWRDGLHTVRTPRNSSASGWLGGRSVVLDGVSFAMDTAKCAVALSSLDGQPLAESQDLLLASVAQVAPTAGNARPLLSEPVRGTVAFRSAHRSLRWQPLGVHAARVAAKTTVAVDGVHRFVFDGEPVHFWRATPAPP